jgi:membrane-bound lytic murein transglycosylase B
VFFFVLIEKMLKKLISIYILLILSFSQNSAFSSNSEFSTWVKNFKSHAVKSGVSKVVVEEVMSKAIFLPNVIKYDRFQPEFYEDTNTYITKRTSKNKVKKGLNLYKKEKSSIDKIEKEFQIEKELLLSLMGIETNFGKYLGKMDIVSSLATLSFDKRRSDFFTKELIILLKLVDQQIIDREILFGSWAGAFGNFQFMPRTIRNYAIDYNKNTTIELKKTEDSFASAANYLSKIGWEKNTPCFKKINLNKNIPIKYLNSSAARIINKKEVKYFKKYIKNYNDLKIDKNLEAAIITPDIDIVPGANTYTPAYLIFSNYEKILNWNRSLRFALAVCTLKNKFKNEI